MTMFWVSPPRFASCMPFRSTATRIERQEHAEHRAGAPEDVHAAEDDGGDDVEQPSPVPASARAEPKKPT